MQHLVTGAAGFIGFHVARRLLARGDTVVGVDNLNDYYDVALKEARLAVLAREAGAAFEFVRADVADPAALAAVFAGPGPGRRFDRVVHLAAQAGVRHSIDHPEAYVAANLVGFANVLEACRKADVPHLTYASTSSVYGLDAALPFREDRGADHPVQLYAATKRANELMAHSYAALFGLPSTGLRFFTAYGPWGRPDMALFIFTRRMLAGEPIPVFNRGNHVRDFTYIDDIAEGVLRASDQIAAPDPAFDPAAPTPDRSSAPFRIYNLGNSAPVPLATYIEALERRLGLKARRELLPLQLGDVIETAADISAIEAAVGYRPAVDVEEGVRRFVDWYLAYHDVAPLAHAAQS